MRHLLLTLLLTLLVFRSTPADAASPADGWLIYGLKVRTGPALTFAPLAALPPGTSLWFEAQNEDGTWLLANAEDGTRGWVSVAFVAYTEGYDPSGLDVSTRVLKPPPTDNWPPSSTFDAVQLAVDDPDFIRTRAGQIDLTAYPILPEAWGIAPEVFERGRALGRSAAGISKVGDCNTTGWVYLHPFGEGQYKLGTYDELQDVINYYTEAFTQRTYAAFNGMNVTAVLDSTWSDPSVCETGESPLACDYRLHNPAVALIMFGTNDMVVISPEMFDYGLRRVVNITIHQGIIPILSTFPRHLSFDDRSLLYNQIVVQIALDYNLPLINLWRALEPLPNHGIADDGFHLNGPLTMAGDLSSEKNLQTGLPLRNLLTLQTLDALLDDIIEGEYAVG